MIFPRFLCIIARIDILLPSIFAFHSQVVRALDSLDDISDLSNGMKPGQSEVFDSAQQSAQIRMFQRMAFGSQDYSTEYFNQSHSSWRSREHSDQTQSNRTSREQGNKSTVINIIDLGYGTTTEKQS